MALFKKFKHSRSKSTADITQLAEDNDTIPPVPSFAANARASKSSDNLTSFSSRRPSSSKLLSTSHTPPLSLSSSTSTSPAQASASVTTAPATPSPPPRRKSWVPRQKLTPQAAIPYRHVPTHAATDAFRTLQGKGYNPNNYWQNLGVYNNNARRTHMKRSQSSSELSSASIDSILCSCSSLKSDDGYYHPLLAAEMRHCCHSPIRKGRAGGSSTASSTPASSVYSADTTTRPSSVKDAKTIRPSKSVSFSLSSSDDEPTSTSPSAPSCPHIRSSSHPNLPSLSAPTSPSPPTHLTEPLPPVPSIPLEFGQFGINDDASTDSGLASIPEGVAYDMSLEEGHGEVVAEAVAEDDGGAVGAWEVDGVVFTKEGLEKLMLGEERVREERWVEGARGGEM